MRRPKRHKSKREICERYKQCKSKNQVLLEIKREREKDIGVLDRRIKELTYQLERVRERDDICRKIIERAATIDFRRCESSYYAIEVRFNGDFMGGISRHGEVQECVADRVARDIRNQIASSKFIETAKANERREYMTNVRRAYQGGEWIDGE